MCPLGSSLRNEEKKTLLDIARKAIALIVTEGRQLEVAALQGALAVPSGAFVTLRKQRGLCGCIGRLSPLESLANVVAHCAAAAATEDPRFSRVLGHELAELEIEISVLSAVQTAQPEDVEAGLHGLVISRNGRRGVLLPQVAREHRWPVERFLEETCRKAGLDANAWKDPETQVEIFTAETFSEAHFPAAGAENTSTAEK
ncbi:MAG TPA: AmmeMemoRadiSam system protein A [Candidatus Acidoferrales bacterium]|nr:AmmeMemoRadiSam system protein A [Candidatus Acidoferrales bacterium]